MYKFKCFEIKHHTRVVETAGSPAYLVHLELPCAHTKFKKGMPYRQTNFTPEQYQELLRLADVGWRAERDEVCRHISAKVNDFDREFPGLTHYLRNQYLLTTVDILDTLAITHRLHDALKKINCTTVAKILALDLKDLQKRKCGFGKALIGELDLLCVSLRCWRKLTPEQRKEWDHDPIVQKWNAEHPEPN